MSGTRSAGLSIAALISAAHVWTAPQTLASGVITTSAPSHIITQTWDNLATAFLASRIDITDTNSHASSEIAQWNVNGIIRYSFSKNGVQVNHGPVASLPGLYIGLDTDVTNRAFLGLQADDTPQLAFGPGVNTPRDTFIRRGGPGILNFYSNISVDPANAAAVGSYSVGGSQAFQYFGGVNWGVQPLNINAPGGLAIIGTNKRLLFDANITSVQASSGLGIYSNSVIAFTTNSGTAAYMGYWSSGAESGRGIVPVDFIGFAPAIISSAPDVVLRRGGVGVLEQYKGSAAQEYRLYYARPDVNNFSRLAFAAGGVTGFTGYHVIEAQRGGVDVHRPIAIGTQDVTSAGLHDPSVLIFTHRLARWSFTNSGHLFPFTNNAHDIGDATHQVRSIHAVDSYFYANLIGAGAAAINWSGRATLFAPGTIGMISMEGITAAFPALKRVTTGLHVCLADDSALSTITAACFTVRVPSGITEELQPVGLALRDSAVVAWGGATWGSPSDTFNVPKLFIHRAAVSMLGIVGEAAGAVGAGIEMTKMTTAPVAPAANKSREWLEDNGSGKMRKMIRFPSGAAVQIAIEP